MLHGISRISASIVDVTENAMSNSWKLFQACMDTETYTYKVSPVSPALILHCVLKFSNSLE